MLRQERVVIENLSPQLHCGAFNIKRVVGDIITVHADVLGDGHDVIQAELQFKHEKDKKYTTARMEPVGNDAFTASFSVEKTRLLQLSGCGLGRSCSQLATRY